MILKRHLTQFLHPLVQISFLYGEEEEKVDKKCMNQKRHNEANFISMKLKIGLYMKTLE